jgi:cation diffusion facilitator CzcD-associated flavoprotein CzcO
VTDHVDVLIVGAGLSGVGAAAHLQDRCPDLTWTILEARDTLGGTWDLFRYPGVRSDSDMFTLGYAFRPWTSTTAIADGATIRGYIADTARERGIDTAIRFGHRVVAAEWSSAVARWTVTAATATGTVTLTCRFLYSCGGYYRYDRGHEPVLPGAERFAGAIVHPQHWPAELQWAGRRVVVVGSGATAVTLVPALAREAAHVTMLQRSPSYLLSVPTRDPLARKLFGGRLPLRKAAALVRARNIALVTLLYRLSRRYPAWVRGRLIDAARAQLPPGYDVDTHFSPAYAPWDQRLCIVPSGDLFRAVRDGRASVVTDRIATLTEHGVALASGEELPADVVVTATGLSLQMLGGATLRVDGRDVDLARSVVYKGVLLSGVPNFALTFGYINASWTLKADLAATYVCRLLRHMSAHGHAVATPVDPPTAGLDPLIGLRSGYVMRAADRLPRRAAAGPWRSADSYPRDLLSLRWGRVAEKHLRFSPAPGWRESHVQDAIRPERGFQDTTKGQA